MEIKAFSPKMILRVFYQDDYLGLVWFYGIPTIVGYLRLNPVYSYILDIYDL